MAKQQYPLETIMENIKPTLQIKNDQVISLSYEQYRLSIVLEEHRLSFSLTHKETLANACIESYDLSKQATPEDKWHYCQEIINQHEILRHTFWASVQLVVSNQSFTLIPATIFRKEYSSKYLQLSRGKALDTSEELHHYSHPKVEIVTVFCTENNMTDWLFENYPFQEIMVLHLTDVLISFLEKQPEKAGIWAYFEKKAFYLMQKHSGKIQFINRFQANTPTDITYFILFALQELKQEIAETNITVMGCISSDSAVLLELEKHIANIHIATATIAGIPAEKQHEFIVLETTEQA